MPNPIINNPEPTNPTQIIDSPAYRAALARMRAELMAMPEDQVERTIRLDPSAAAVAADASATKLIAYRPALVERFGPPAGTLVDELSIVARCTRQADVELSGTEVMTDLSPMHEEVRAQHQLLITDADALANRKLIDPARLEPARDVQGYQALIHSVLVLVHVLHEHWPKIQGHTPLTKADLDRAEAIAQRMSAALGERESGASRAPALELRTRALSKLVHHYEEIRRMMSFLRWYQDDADSITPSLWTNRSRKARSSNGNEPNGDEPTDTDIVVVSPTPVAPTPNNGGAPFTA